MNLNAQRHWTTPLVIGSFLLMAVTGILMFFHLDGPLNKSAHEWLGWLMVAGVVLHVLTNSFAFQRYFKQTTGRLVVGGFALVLALSFLRLGGADGGKPPFFAPVTALAHAPLTAVAPVAGITVGQLRERLATLGVQSQSDDQTLAGLVGNDLGDQMKLMSRLLAAPSKASQP